MHRKVFYRQTYTASIQCIQKWFTVTEETANIDHFPQIYTLHERGAKTLGMRQSAVSSLTGYVGTVRQSGTSSPVRHLQPPMNRVRVQTLTDSHATSRKRRHSVFYY